MSTRRLVWFREIARYARSAASIGLVFLSVRFAWLSSAEAMEGVRKEAGRQKEEEASTQRTEQQRTEQQRTEQQRTEQQRTEQQRRDPKRAADQFRDVPQLPEPSAEPATDQPRLRRLLVDLGPERSEVFVQGKAVGRVPFAGQISCVEGRTVIIDILPPQGAPVRRTLKCRSDLLSVMH